MPEPPEPTREEKVRWMVRTSTDIVSGRLLRGLGREGRYRFLVERVYKGKLRRGAILSGWQGWGLDPSMCPGMIPPPPLPRGARGAIYFNGEPEINFVADDDMERAFALGLLQGPRQSRRR
jgi:hypothetical protein